MEGSNRLNGNELSRLIPQLSTILIWLRQNEPRTAGDLVLTHAKTAGLGEDETHSALRSLLQMFDFSEGGLTNNQLKYIFSQHELPVWAEAVWLLMVNSNPRVVPPAVCEEIMNKAPGVARVKKITNEDLGKLLGPEMDQLRLDSFHAFGEFLALLRDACQDTNYAAETVAGMLLLGPVRSGDPKSQAEAQIVMNAMINNCAGLFGQPGARMKPNAWGVRKNAGLRRLRTRENMSPETKSPKASPLGSKAKSAGAGPAKTPPPMPDQNMYGARSGDFGNVEEMRLNKLKNDLRAFFEWRAREFIYIVDSLFEYFEIVDIAEGLFYKYQQVPAGWRAELMEQQSKGVNMPWFNPSLARVDSGGKARPISYVAPVSSKPMPIGGKRSVTNQAIDEMLDQELSFYSFYTQFYQTYIVELKNIAQGQRGGEASDALGLTYNEVDQAFGWRVLSILEISRALLTQLEIINLTRKEPTKTNIGREGIVSRIFLQFSTQLMDYAPFFSSHITAISIIKSGSDRVDKKKKKAKFAQSFTQIWNTFTLTTPSIRGMSLEQALLEPAHVLLRYKKMFAVLAKDTPKSHPGHAFVVAANINVRDVLLQIHDVVAQSAEQAARGAGGEVRELMAIISQYPK